MSLARGVWHGLVVVCLTLLTQLGGLAYLASRYPQRRLLRWAVFAAVYAGLSLGAMVTAPAFGRVPLPCTGDTLRPQSILYCVLNRHYVSPDLKRYVTDMAVATAEQYPGAVTLTLDGAFPFFDGFPLLPHLSHEDGDKLDLAFYYRDRDRTYRPGETASLIGYWAFEPPEPGADLPCAERSDWLTLRWDMGWLAPLHKDLSVDPLRTRAALLWLTLNVPDGYDLKTLLEPHLEKRLGLKLPQIRFQGCRAARHDDHIHFQITAKS